MSNFIPTDEQWSKMKQFIKSDKYKKEDFFVFETLAVGDKIVPNRYIRIMPDLLSTMKDDAQKGVSLMLNHNWSQAGVQSIPIGKVFDARLDGPSQNGETATLYTTQYILRDDSKVDGYSKNDIINLIESGILADTSIGWGTTSESYKCSICGNSIYDYRKCEHIPGKKYIVNEQTNEVKECIIEAHSPNELHVGNNVLMENSIVFDGAYPNAIIQSAVGDEIDTPKGKFKALDGKEELSSKDLIIGYSTNGSINLMCKHTMEKGGNEMEEELENIPQETPETTPEVVEGTVETTEEVVETPAETQEEVVEGATEETVEEAETVEETTEEATEETSESFSREDILSMFGNVADSLEGLISLAKDGLSHRQEVITEALNSGVRAMGNSFNKEIFSRTFANLDTKAIKEMADAWETQVSNQFSTEKVSKETSTFANEDEKVELAKLNAMKTTNY